MESSECIDFHAQCVMVGRYAFISPVTESKQNLRHLDDDFQMLKMPALQSAVVSKIVNEG